MHDRDRRNVHFLAHDDGPCALIHHHACGAIGFDREPFQFGQELGGRILLGHRHAHQRGVLGARYAFRAGGEFQVHSSSHTGCGREIRLTQLQLDHRTWRHGWSCPLDDRSTGNASYRGMVHRRARASPSCHEAVNHDRSLRHGVHVPVGAAYRS